jgi:hypothetical protein
MTSLVDYYLLQLKSYLPAKHREDIAAELGETIRSTIEERERTLGRKLSDEELGAVLKGYGHPLLIAGRYLPMQHLIGPAVFPVYWYALQAVTIVIAVIGGLLAGVALLIADRPAQVALQVLANVFWIALLAGAVVTFVFAVMDHERVRLPFLEAFEPRRRLNSGILGVRAAPLSPISRQDTIFELATTAILLIWWIGWLDFSNILPPAIAVEFTREIEPFYWPVVGVCVIELVRLGSDFVRPYRTPLRTIWRLCLNAAWLALVVLLFRADGLIEAGTALNGAGEAERAVRMMETSLRVTLFVLGMIMAALIATDIVRLVRR